MSRIAALTDGARVRVTVEGVVDERLSTKYVLRFRGGGEVHGDLVTAVEVISGPLPTEPGTRFWGKYGPAAPEWWFAHLWQPELVVRYVSASGHIIRCDDDRAQHIVRLPDPDGAP